MLGFDAGLDLASGPDRTTVWSTTPGFEPGQLIRFVDHGGEAFIGVVRENCTAAETASDAVLNSETIQRVAEQLRRVESDLIAFGYSSVRLEPGAVNYVERLDLGAIGRPTATMTVERMREAAAAVKRGEALLRAWLSSEQLASYERRGSFEVRGGATGRRYRIRSPSSSFNVDVLSADSGEVTNRLCFLPEGELVNADIMLAQKLALETDETAALKVANEQLNGGGRWLIDGRWLNREWLTGDWPVDIS